MLSIPSPLHPAIVHFPIVLILVGTVIALASIFVRRWHLPWIAASLLILGAVGTVAATWSGEEDEEILGAISDPAEELLEEHEEWGEITRNLSLIAAFMAIATIATSRFVSVSRGFGIVAALFALGASYAVLETGHYGGQLVYKQGVGINTSAGNKHPAEDGTSRRSSKKSCDDD